MTVDRNDMALLAKAGDENALKSLCVSFGQDIRRASGKLAQGAIMFEPEDLAQIGYEVLINMLETWDPNKAPFEAYFRMGLTRRLKKHIYAQNGQNVGMPANVNGALRSYQAKKAAGEEVGLDDLARAWGINVEWLEAAIEIDEGLQELVEAHIVPSDEYTSELESAVMELGLSTQDVNLIIAVREYGVAGVARLTEKSERTIKKDFEAAMERAAKELDRD